VLYAYSKSDAPRLDEIARFTGIARDEATGTALLALTNEIWRTNTVPSRFISDSMVATWRGNPALHRDMPDLLTEEDQYRLLVWYCCARPLDSGCQMSAEPVDPILDRMAFESVAESPNERLPYTALMYAPRAFSAAPDDVCWFASFRDDGTWQAVNHHLLMLDRERVGREAIPSAAVLDSQSVKTTEAGGPRGYDAAKKINGSKRHALVDTDGR
jgi:hypothetical protein